MVLTSAYSQERTSGRGDEFRMLGEFLRDELGTPVRGQ
jgi:hypothetical protein